MPYEFILALDPSGSYNEGKGTTGWCVLECAKNEITLADSFTARSYKYMETYWQAHLDLIKKYHDRYGKKLVIVIEDYMLYKTRASSQINSRMETCKVIGIMQHYCYMHRIPYEMQLAATVKKRWSDEILEHKRYLIKHGTKHKLPHAKTILNGHAKDAIRHAVHFQNFKRKEV